MPESETERPIQLRVEVSGLCFLAAVSGEEDPTKNGLFAVLLDPTKSPHEKHHPHPEHFARLWVDECYCSPDNQSPTNKYEHLTLSGEFQWPQGIRDGESQDPFDHVLDLSRITGSGFDVRFLNSDDPLVQAVVPLPFERIPPGDREISGPFEMVDPALTDHFLAWKVAFGGTFSGSSMTLTSGGQSRTVYPSSGKIELRIKNMPKAHDYGQDPDGSDDDDGATHFTAFYDVLKDHSGPRRYPKKKPGAPFRGTMITCMPGGGYQPPK